MPFSTPFTTQPKLPEPSTADGPSHNLRNQTSHQGMLAMAGPALSLGSSITQMVRDSATSSESMVRKR